MNNPILNTYNDYKKRHGKSMKVIKSDFTTIDIIGILKESTDGNSGTDHKKLIVDISSNVNQGDLITYENITYLILNKEEDINSIYCNYICQRCDQEMRMYIDNILEEIPCIIEVGSQGIDENQYISTIAGNVKLTVQDNLITKKIIYDNRIIIMGTPYKVVAFTNEHKGLRYLYLEKTQFSDVDNKELEIADYWKYNTRDVYRIESSDATLNIGETKKIDYKLFKNDIEIIDVATFKIKVIYNTAPLNIIKVDNLGLVTGLKEGTDTIIITYKDVVKTINITVIPLSDKFSISILGESTTYMNMDEIYNAKVMNNGIEIDKNVDWSVGDLTFAKIVSKSEMNCKLKINMKNIFGTFKLKCWLIDDVNIFVEKDIKITRM